VKKRLSSSLLVEKSEYHRSAAEQQHFKIHDNEDFIDDYGDNTNSINNTATARTNPLYCQCSIQ
jgi:hypothetical protein